MRVLHRSAAAWDGAGGSRRPGSGTARDMDPHPHQAEADEADPDKQSTPAGFAPDLEDKADEIGATTDDAPPAP